MGDYACEDFNSDRPRWAALKRAGTGKADPVAPLGRRFSRIYLSLMVVRVVSSFALCPAFVFVIAEPENVKLAAIASLAAMTVYVVAWCASAVAGLLWCRGKSIGFAVAQFTSLDLMPAAAVAAGLDAARWGAVRQRLNWTFALLAAAMVVTLLLGIWAGGWSISVR